MRRLDSMSFLFAYAWRMNKSLFFITTAKSIFSAFLPLINVVGIGIVVNALLTNADYNEVMRFITVYLSFNLGIAVISEILTLLNNMVVRKISNILQFNYMHDCIFIDYHYVQDRSILELKKKSMPAHPAIFLSDMGNLLNYIVQFSGIIYIFSVLSPLFILILLVTSTISVGLTFNKHKYDFDFDNARAEEDRKLDYLYNVMSEYKFAKEIRINNAEAYVGNKYSGILRIQIGKLKAYYSKSMQIGILSALVTIIQTVAMYFYFSYQVFSKQITIAEYTVLLGATTLLTSILLGFFDNIAKIGRTCKYASLFQEYIDLIKAKSQITASNQLGEKNIDFANAVVRFENVSFVYPDTDRMILKNINIEIKKGERIGIVGLNGSGKTTFIKLLTRTYDPSEGRITINGTDIRDIPYQQYIKHVGIVLQDFLLFAYSIKENIVFDKTYDESKLKSSIEKSGLAHKIHSLENGVDTMVYKEIDDRGIEFSGGEGQKLALARAVYKDADMLILDEPTSALDPIAEYELFAKLSDIAGNKTTLFISHRLSSTKFCDRIFVLSNGEIAECGNHSELIKKNGVYADLFNAQAKYYEERRVAL